uniref:AlNc14C719G12439 protein n=1 Tax=Albugo laibachii Nc14 TaxID=890382 RepID=F0WEE1_9STRA|nr:AlNc14C73G4998 [Albugo laibachii Nc14]CCA27819.1 AlNc14C719G12439 [Albugo laibachii Nc14]|eukprot:CCA27819.1 AlNc14C719G12439 [Albugo laibachii Nc14]
MIVQRIDRTDDYLVLQYVPSMALRHGARFDQPISNARIKIAGDESSRSYIPNPNLILTHPPRLMESLTTRRLLTISQSDLLIIRGEFG